MKKLLFLLFAVSFTANAQKPDYKTIFEKGNGNQGANYEQTIAFYQLLARDFPTIKIEECGLTDSGKPLHLVLFSSDKDFNYPSEKKSIVLINNGIHAGEPDGIDATMMLVRDLASGKVKAPKNVIFATIPVYNIGGFLNRNSTSRANQDGPEEYGFRGNARNFDLNRDFIKSDTRNTKSLTDIFRKLDADIFIDNHVSNGADYQYTLTYIQTQHNRLGTVLGDYMNSKLSPAIFLDLKKKKIESTPYVNVWGGTPDAHGFAQFNDSPRYATGYTSLFNAIGFVVETHMLKKYDKRVKATYEFMVSAIDFADKNASEIKAKRLENEKQFQAGKPFPVAWEIDSAKVSTIEFLGFEGGYKKSEVTTGDRLFYDRKKPFKKTIPFYKDFRATKNVVIPEAYVIPQAWWNVISLLQLNGIRGGKIKKDTIIEVESYRIADYKTGTSAYEGHYLHRNTKVTSERIKLQLRQGDFIFPTNQKGVKYLLETLEPEAGDSFFNWNFFDAILQQKEWYSDYVFEDLAAELLKKNPKLQAELDEKRKSDEAFAKNPEAQLAWVYQHSQYAEKSFLQYPVYRIVK